MLTSKFDFLVAEYKSLEDVDAYEVEEADMVIIRGYVPGGIYHPTNMYWFGNIKGLSDPLSFVRSKKERKALRKSRDYYEEQGYEFKVVPMNEELYLQFANLYEETTLDRDRAVRYSIEKVLDSIKSGKPRYVAGMFEGEVLKSALIFAVKGSGKVGVSFGAKQKCNDTRGGIGGVLEMELLDYCIKNGIDEVGHGRSPNPAGISGSAGIFEFKTRYGYSAFPRDYWETSFIKNRKVAISDLVYVTSIEDKIGYLVVSDKKERLVRNKYVAAEVDEIKVVSFDKVLESHKKKLDGMMKKNK